MNLKSDFLNFDKKILKSSHNEIFNYYGLLDYESNEKIVLNIKDVLLNSDNKVLSKLINSFVYRFENVSNIDWNDYKNFKNWVDLIKTFMSFFILKNFYEKISKKVEYWDNFYNCTDLEYQEFSYLTSDDLINATLKNFKSFILYFEIIYGLNWFYEKDLFRNLFFCSYEILVDANIIEKIKTNKNKKSYIIYMLKHEFECIIPSLNFYTSEFHLYKKNENIGEIYLYSSHFSSVDELLIPNKFSDLKFEKEFDENPWPDHFYICKTRLKIIFETCLKFYNKNADFLETEAVQLRKNISKSLKEGDFFTSGLLMKELSVYLHLLKLKNFIKIDFDGVKFYKAHKFCFRGRFYEVSDASRTFFKEFRYCIYSGFYKNDSEYVKQHPLNNKINDAIIEQFYLLENLVNYREIKNRTSQDKITFIFLLISIAELKKSELGKEIHLKDFIKMGIDILNNPDNFKFDDLYEKIKVDYLIFLINELLSDSKKMWVISKDATASCFQHLIKIVGSKNDAAYKICNLDSLDTWYDPYTFLLEDFQKCSNLSKKEPELFKKLFSRKSIKLIIMPESYGAKLESSYKKFKIMTKLDDLKLNKKLKIEIKETFKQFFLYLKENPLLFENSTEEIIDLCIKLDNLEFTMNDGSKIKLAYFKSKTKQFEFKINNRRCTRQVIFMTGEYDLRKFKLSVRANYTHAMDAALARWYNLITGFSATHDCFYMDYKNPTYLLSIINEGMNKIFHILKNLNKKKPIYSIFIVL